MRVDVIEAEDRPGNLDDLVKSLSGPTIEEALNTPENKEEASPERVARTLEVKDEELPERMRGKSMSEIVDMYKNLESVYGRMANDLGQQRKLTDRLLDLKRESDLQTHTPKIEIKSADLLDNPVEAIEKVVSARLSESEKQTQARVQQLEGQLAAQTFITRHPDFNQIANDPEFGKWVRGTSYRARLADQAMSGDWGVADELVSEFKDRKGAKPAPKDEESEEIAGAKKVSLESKTAQEGNSKKSGKIFRRVDLIALKMNKPDVYYDDAVQTEIIRAYNEGRVK